MADHARAEKDIADSDSVLPTIREQRATTEAKLSQVSDLKREEETRLRALEVATATRDQISKADAKIHQLHQQVTTDRQALQPAEEQENTLTTAEQSALTASKSGEAAHREAAEAVRQIRLHHDLATAQVAAFEKSETHQHLATRAAEADTLRTEITTLRTQHSQIPPLTTKELTQLRSLERESSQAAATLAAIATGIELLQSDTPVNLDGKTLNTGESCILTDTCELAIGPGTRLRIRPGGGGSLADARLRTDSAQSVWSAALARHALRDLDHAATVCEQRQSLEQQIAQLETRWKALGGENLTFELNAAVTALAAATADVQRRQEILAQAPSSNSPETLTSARELVSTTREKLSAAESAEAAARHSAEQSRAKLESATQAIHNHRAALATARQTLRDLETSIKVLEDTHGDAPARQLALTQATQTCQQAAEQLAATRAALAALAPASLSADLDRFTRAIAQQETRRREAENQRLIAHCLAVGKRVLFVAEKRAALDVVHRRLREDGLEPFCLELHSNKTGKADVLAQFDRSLKFAEELETTDWEHRATELERLRAALNSYSRALHKRLPCGLSAYHCLDYLLARKDQPTVKMDGWTTILETPVETLEQGRQVARLMQERIRPLSPLADHALSPLACEDWSPGWAERSFELNAELAKQCQQAAEATRELLKWMQLNRSLSRVEMGQLDELLDALLSPEPVGPAFATTPWAQLSMELASWLDLVTERSGLREALSSLYPDRAAAAAAVPCELVSRQEADEHFQKGRDLDVLLKSAAGASENLLWWLGAPQPEASRGQLMDLAALAECLLETDEVGAGFATTPWETWSPSFDRWIALVRERSEIRAKLDGYDESQLLALDLDLLQQKWNKSRTAWFVLKMLNTSAVRSNLAKALPAKVKPDESGMGDVVASAIRLRGINRELATIYSTAETLLGKSWKGGEPDGAQMERIRSWGESLHQRLGKVAGSNTEWLASMRKHLVGYFQSGPAVFAPGKSDGDRLIAMRDSFKAFDAASMDFTNAAQLDRNPPDQADDHLPAVAKMLETFLGNAPRLRELNSVLASVTPAAMGCLGVTWLNGEPDAEAIRKVQGWGEVLHRRILAVAGEDFGWLGTFRSLLSGLFSEGPAAYAPNTPIGERMNRFRDSWAAFNGTYERYANELRLRREALDQSSDCLAATLALTERVSIAWPKIREWCSWQKVRQQSVILGLAPVVEKLESAEGSAVDVPGLFERSFRRGLLFAIIEKEGVLREFFGNEHNERIERFRALDEQLAKLSRDLIRSRLALGIPKDDPGSGIPREEIGLLRRELGKRMRHIPVRQLISKIPTLLPRLKPCVLMSPLSVAQYLQASHEVFDVVIFDEASQIPVWDAIGAIARGRQLIIVGDPKQLPPTNFFSTNADDEDDLTPEEHKDLESILDELMTHGLRHKRLKWHYRSRHEGLITFSNRQYYENDLLTFPSPEMEHGGVRFRHLPDARYDKGKSRTNRGEAEALVKELVCRLRNPLLPRRSYGVVTFSQAQQALVENLLDEERRNFPEIEHHFGDDPPVEGEPVFVKNLENVQGDERDVILFSICYGLDEAGKLSMNFGPLNRDGGERRLNVAVTRAKHEVLVFSGLRGDQIDLTRTRARGVRDLKHFLEYAERGPRALIAATSSPSQAEADSEFERMVADRIRAAGYEVHHQVGCSGYRVDLGIVDSAAPGRYLLGVECDGATYHRAATARDRDKLRQAVLEDLGWTLHRIWSTDWWHNADSEMEKLLAAISSAVEARQHQYEEDQTKPDSLSVSREPDTPKDLDPTASGYETTDFSPFLDRISADCFYSSEYEPTLRELVAHVVETEGPILDAQLVNRIARAHGLQRSGRVINERVMEIAKRHFHIKPDRVGGNFVWRDRNAPLEFTAYRTSSTEQNARVVDQIPFEEIRAAIPSKPVEDLPLEIARVLGIRRLTAIGRTRIQAVIDACSTRDQDEA